MPKSLVIIPARYASVRLPGKTLLRDTGKYLVQHVYERAVLASRVDEVVVATDDERVVAAVESLGGGAFFTTPRPGAATARGAGAPGAADADFIINVQGDEPEIEPAAIDLVIDLLERRPNADMATLASPLTDPARIASPNVVKVVLDGHGYALYFSRAPIPASKSYPGLPPGEPRNYLAHVGIYGFRRPFLFRYASLDRSPLERRESLEQLRALENGHRIIVGVSGYQARGIDTPEDYAEFLERWRARHPA